MQVIGMNMSGMIKETTLSQKTEQLCTDRDYIALNELYHQLVDKFMERGFMPSSRYDAVLSPYDIMVSEPYRCRYEIRVRCRLSPLDASDVERVRMVDASVYSLILSLAVLREAPELYAVHRRDGALLFGMDTFKSAGGPIDAIITKYSVYPDISRCYDAIRALREGRAGRGEWAGEDHGCDADKSQRPDVDGWCPIHHAAAEGDIVRFRKLAVHNRRLGDRIRDGRTVLHIAVQNLNRDIVRYLVEELGFDVNLQERMRSKTPLHRAIDNDDVEMVDYLVKHGADYARYSLSPLSYAIERKSIRAIRYFINNGMIDVNSRDSYGEAPLSYAISGGDVEIVRLLIGSGASPLLVDGSGVPPVELAVRSGNLDIVRSIVESASLSFGLLKQLHDYAVDNSTAEVAAWLADMCTESTGRHSYARISRIDDMRSVIPSVAKVINIDADTAKSVMNDPGDRRRHFAMCELAMLPELLAEIKEGGVDVRGRNEFGYTLLHVACDKGYDRIVEQLIASGAKVDVPDNTGGAFSMMWRRRGETPLHRAAAINSFSIVRMLIEAGAKVNCYDYYHTTPLHFAALHGNYQMVRLLVDAGAKVSVRDDDGNEPVLMAVRSGGVAIVGCLLDNGANVNTASNSGETPLHRATRLGEVETALFLLKRGADINAQDIGYKSPLHISVEKGLCRLAEEYVRMGADTEALDMFDKASGHYAARSGDERLWALFK